MRSLEQTLTQSDWWPYKKRKLGHKDTLEEDREKMAIFKPRRQSSEGTRPADTMISDFQPLEL